MCSIVGAAGPIHELTSKKRQEFHEFLSCLFTMAELRGRDASGFWVWRDDHYVYEKRPIPAQDLIERSMKWKSLRFNPGQLYILHTRAATDGDPNDNINNHPHLGDNLVMVHNGCIWSHQNLISTYKLNMKSNCDSEALLRLVETEDSVEDGLRKAYKVVHNMTGTATVACAVIDRRNPDRIFLSRNNGNPCYVFHSKRFNCTFFSSTDVIFEKAIETMYGTGKKPAIIDATAESVTPYWLYELMPDGSYAKRHFVEVSTTYSTGYGTSYHGNSYKTIDWTADTKKAPFVAGNSPVTAYQLDILGNFTEVVDIEKDLTDDETNEEDDFSDLDVAEMPIEVQSSLQDFLKQYIEEH